MAELRALRQCWNDIIDAIPDSEVGTINGCLYSNNVYGDRQRDAIDSKQTACDKMNELLKATEKKIKRDPATFDTLLQALREESAYSDLANQLERARNKASKSSSDPTVKNGRNKSGSSGRRSNSRALVGSQLDRIKVKICKSVADESAVLNRLANELRSERLITSAVQNSVKFVDGRNPYDKANDMITPAIEHVRSDLGEYGPALFRALNEVGLESVAKELSSLITAAGITLREVEDKDSQENDDDNKVEEEMDGRLTGELFDGTPQPLQFQGDKQPLQRRRMRPPPNQPTSSDRLQPIHVNSQPVPTAEGDFHMKGPRGGTVNVPFLTMADRHPCLTFIAIICFLCFVVLCFVVIFIWKKHI